MNTDSPWGRYFWYALGFLGIAAGLTYLTTEVKSATLEELPKITAEMIVPVVQIGDFCSGAFIKSEKNKRGEIETYVLTAKHCIKKVGQTVSVSFEEYNFSRFPSNKVTLLGKVACVDKHKDLAQIKINNNTAQFKTAKIADRELADDLNFGETTYSVSYPLGGSITYTEGTLGYQEYAEELYGNFYQRSTANIAPGSSGSPLYVQDRKGDYVVIGVLTGSYKNFPFMGLYTTITDLNNFLEKECK